MFLPLCLNIKKCCLLQKEYKKDLESKIKGKGMQIGTDTLEIQRAKRAVEIASEVSRVGVQAVFHQLY